MDLTNKCVSLGESTRNIFQIDKLGSLKAYRYE